MTAAAWWFRHQCRRTLRGLRDPRWQVVLAVSPDLEGMESRVWPRHVPRIPQGSGDLGDRMARIFRTLPPGPVLIVGSDVPGITRAQVARAFDALRGQDAVVGPAPDGGYWLIGFRRQRPIPDRLFEGVRWSGPHALADTLGTMTGLRVARTATLADVDTAGDLP